MAPRHFGSSHNRVDGLSDLFRLCNLIQSWIDPLRIMSSLTGASSGTGAGAALDAGAAAVALVDAEISAATAGRHELAAVPPPPRVPQRVSEVPEGLATSFFLQLGADPDTPMEDVWLIPETDLKETLTAMTYLTAIQRGKLIRELRGLWESAGFAPPTLGAAVRPAPAPPPSAPAAPEPADPARTRTPAIAEHAHVEAAAVEVGALAVGSGPDAHGGGSAGPVPGGALPLLGLPGALASMGVVPGGSTSSMVPAVPADGRMIIPRTALLDVPLRRFVDQSLHGEAKAFAQEQLDACATRYRMAFDLDPPEDSDPSPEQLAALWHVMAVGLAPYADFAVFNAFGARLNRLTDIDAQVLGPGGSLITRRLKAPSTYDAWESCWKLFASSMVMLGAAGIGALDLYVAGIKLAATQFPGRWELVVATDFLVRSEQWARLRRTFSRTQPAGFDPARPWGYVIAASAYGAQDSPMKEWWSNRFVLPILTTTSTQAAKARIAILDGSATACGSLGAGGSESSRRVRSRTPPPRRTEQDKDKSKDKGNIEKEVCNLYNDGKKPCAGKAVCSYGRQHVCRKCGGTHTADKCDGSGPNAGGKRKRNRNRGKGNKA